MKNFNTARSFCSALVLSLVAAGSLAGAAHAQVVNQQALGGGNTPVSTNGTLNANLLSGDRSSGSISATGAINQASASNLQGLAFPPNGGTLLNQGATNYASISTVGTANTNTLGGYGSSLSIGSVGAGNAITIGGGLKK